MDGPRLTGSEAASSSHGVHEPEPGCRMRGAVVAKAAAEGVGRVEGPHGRFLDDGTKWTMRVNTLVRLIEVLCWH
jgi:hypothetical protein